MLPAGKDYLPHSEPQNHTVCGSGQQWNGVSETLQPRSLVMTANHCHIKFPNVLKVAKRWKKKAKKKGGEGTRGWDGVSHWVSELQSNIDHAIKIPISAFQDKKWRPREGKEFAQTPTAG